MIPVPPGEIPGVLVVPLRTFADSRGRFRETYREEWIPGRPRMVQANRSDSEAGVLRGLHFHRRQADYWYCQGKVFAALADLRPGSPTQGRVATLELGEDADVGLYVPPGVAHGFCALSAATMAYLVDQYYDGKDEYGVAWNDPDLAIPWPVAEPVLSERDQANPLVRDIDPETLVEFEQ